MVGWSGGLEWQAGVVGWSYGLVLQAGVAAGPQFAELAFCVVWALVVGWVGRW